MPIRWYRFLIAAFILYSAIAIVREATNILMENAPGGIDMDRLVASLRAVPRVSEIHDLHVWTVGDGMNLLSCHVVLPDSVTLDDCTTVIAAMKDRLFHDFAIAHATIQTETERMCAQERLHGPYCGMEPQPAHVHAH